MSCTPDFIRQNHYVTDPNNISQDFKDSIEYLTPMNVAINAYNAGQPSSCDAIMNPGGSYDLFAGITNKINTKTQNLIDTCVNVDTQFKIVMDKTQQLEGEINELSADEQTAKLRVELLRTRDVDVTNHQVFLLGRPLRPASIPLLWALSVLFIGSALLIFYMFNPFDLSPSNALLFQAYLFIRTPVFIGVSITVVTIAIIVGILYKAGVL
jgi:hypothetical protein